MTRKELCNQSDSFINKNVFVEGTNWDRRRKVTKDLVYKMSRMKNAGKSYSEIAKHYGLSYTAVKYNLDPNYAQYLNSLRTNYACSPSKVTPQDRAEYKRDLISSGKKLIYA